MAARFRGDKRPHVERKLQQHLSQLYSSEFTGVPRIEEVNPLIAVLRMVKVEYCARQPQLYKMLVAILYDYNPALGAQHYINTKRYVSILLEELPQIAHYINSILPTPACSATKPNHSLHVLGKQQSTQDSNQKMNVKNHVRDVICHSSTALPAGHQHPASQAGDMRPVALSAPGVKSVSASTTQVCSSAPVVRGIVKKYPSSNTQNSIDQEFIQKMKASGQGLCGGTSSVTDSKILLSNTRIRSKFPYGQEMIMGDKRTLATNSQLEQRIQEYIASKARLLGKNGQLLDIFKSVPSNRMKKNQAPLPSPDAVVTSGVRQLQSLEQRPPCSTPPTLTPLACLQKLVNSTFSIEEEARCSQTKASMTSHPLLYLGGRSLLGGQIAAVTVVSVRPSSNTPLYVISPSSTTVASVITTGPYQTTHTRHLTPLARNMSPGVPAALGSAAYVVDDRSKDDISTDGVNEDDESEDSDAVDDEGDDADDESDSNIGDVTSLNQCDGAADDDDDASSQDSYVDIDGDADLDVPCHSPERKFVVAADPGIQANRMGTSGYSTSSIKTKNPKKRKSKLLGKKITKRQRFDS